MSEATQENDRLVDRIKAIEEPPIKMDVDVSPTGDRAALTIMTSSDDGAYPEIFAFFDLEPVSRPGMAEVGDVVVEVGYDSLRTVVQTSSLSVRAIHDSHEPSKNTTNAEYTHIQKKTTGDGEEFRVTETRHNIDHLTQNDRISPTKIYLIKGA